MLFKVMIRQKRLHAEAQLIEGPEPMADMGAGVQRMGSLVPRFFHVAPACAWRRFTCAGLDSGQHCTSCVSLFWRNCNSATNLSVSPSWQFYFFINFDSKFGFKSIILVQVELNF
jgi:hypothetical protein